MVHSDNRVGVGCYVDPITPLWGLRASSSLDG